MQPQRTLDGDASAQQQYRMLTQGDTARCYQLKADQEQIPQALQDNTTHLMRVAWLVGESRLRGTRRTHCSRRSWKEAASAATAPGQGRMGGEPSIRNTA
eukprot:1158282-Pelagomonas_calceolata.AAC.7